MKTNIPVTLATTAGYLEVDLDHIPMGLAFTDHMLIAEYAHGKWNTPQILPMAPLSTHPSAMALHYGQAIFEGLKVTRGIDGNPVLFRPFENAKRLNLSADRMGMPAFPVDLFVESLEAFVAVEHNWVPSADGSALYLRPFMYADEAYTGMRAATSYKFVLFGTPTGPYFNRRIRLYAETQYIRAAQGGTGEAKAAGNYAAAIRPTELAKQKGYDQVLWLDAQSFDRILEVGTMNIFFKIKGEFITPELDGTVLAGVTRSSVIELLKDMGFTVTERTVSIQEILEASANGTLEEAFGTGTAVGIALIDEIGYQDNHIVLPKGNPVGEEVNRRLNAIKTQKEADPFGWIIPVNVPVLH